MVVYWNEQSRVDREKYVEIKWDNIPAKWKYAFDICKDCDVQDLPYDIGSIMHYTAWAFAKDKTKPTIVPKNGASLNALGQSNGFSESDVTGLNNLFCKDTCYYDKSCRTEITCKDATDTVRCKKYAGWKYCEKYSAWMTKWCAKSCSICKP